MYESNCLLHMNKNGIPFQGPLITDGAIHRFSIDTKRNQPDEWYVAHLASLPSGQAYLYCSYGSWSDGTKFEYKSWNEASNKIYYSSVDRKILHSKIEENKRLVLREEQKKAEETAKKAQEIWQSSSSTGNHAYLIEKQIQAYGIRFSDRKALLIPLKDIEGKLHSLQFIYQENGRFLKRFLQGGKKQGYFHLMGTINENSLICIAEGYATGASWHEATFHPTVIAFDSGNLFSVTQAIRARYPSNQILIIGDDDVNSKINVGREKAKEAAKAHDCLTIFPEFKLQRAGSSGKAFTDFNDLHISHGLREIQIQLETLMGKQKIINAYLSFKELENLIDRTDSFEDLSGYVLESISTNKEHLNGIELKRLNKKLAKKTGVTIQDLQEEDKEIHHRSIALAVIDSFGNENLLECIGRIWKWNETGLWEPIDDRIIKRRIHELMENRKITKFSVNSVLDITKTEIFMANHRFDVDSRAINCLNGELYFKDGNWRLETHDRENYRTTQIPILYDPQATAPRFEQFLGEIFEDDKDAEEKKIIVCELLGYSLLTSCEFEKFVILLGNGANGKSVLLHIVEQLVGTAHVSAVQPSQFDNRFQRAHLFGKLVNIVTEIAEGAEIADAQLKGIVSGERTTAEHKHKNPFDFHPFCTCWFGTNHMPHCRDFSDAIFRRTIILSFNKKFDGTNRDVHLRQKLQKEMSGILNLALEGIAGVFKRGDFTYCLSSEAAKKQWRFECDQVEQFVTDACELSSGLRSSSQDIFRAYTSWAKEMGVRRVLGHNGLTQRLQKLGVENSKGTNGKRMLSGIAIKQISVSGTSGA